MSGDYLVASRDFTFYPSAARDFISYFLQLITHSATFLLLQVIPLKNVNAAFYDNELTLCTRSMCKYGAAR
jgi:hypothetical protein